MPHDRFSCRVVAFALGLNLAVGAAAAQGQAVSADNLTAVMAAAMGRMDHDMMAPATGDADRDFVTIMIPHHQGAVEMAEAEFRFGRDPVLRRLAQGIIVGATAGNRRYAPGHSGLPAVPAATLTPMHMHRDH